MSFLVAVAAVDQAAQAVLTTMRMVMSANSSSQQTQLLAMESPACVER